jgi:hypothetical protein
MGVVGVVATAGTHKHAQTLQRLKASRSNMFGESALLTAKAVYICMYTYMIQRDAGECAAHYEGRHACAEGLCA